MAGFTMPCVVLSGGMGSRMGKCKQDLLVPKHFFKGDSTFVKEPTLADFQASRLQQTFEKVYFSAKTPIANICGFKTILDRQEPSKICDSTFKDKTLHIKSPLFAPIFALWSVLEALKCDCFILSIDTPFFDKSAINAIFSAFKGQAIFAKNTKAHPLLGIYPFSALAQINAQINAQNFKLMDLLEGIKAEFVEIPLEKTRNLNTLEEYKIAFEL